MSICNVIFDCTDLDNCQVDPFCQQLCHLSSRSLTIASDVSYRVRIRLTELGFVTSLLNSLQDFASSQFSEVSMKSLIVGLIFVYYVWTLVLTHYLLNSP